MQKIKDSLKLRRKKMHNLIPTQLLELLPELLEAHVNFSIKWVCPEESNLQMKYGDAEVNILASTEGLVISGQESLERQIVLLDSNDDSYENHYLSFEVIQEVIDAAMEFEAAKAAADRLTGSRW
jgi:hypothetical protein